MRTTLLFTLILTFVLSSCWKRKSPENLPVLKDAFKNQVAKFESKKEKANQEVNDGMSSLQGLQGALEDAKNQDKEFSKVYGDWEKVNKKVDNLNKEYEDLKEKANNLFTGMENQTNSLSDQKSKTELLGAISKAKKKYNATLANTSTAIGKLRVLHTDALDVVKALEVAVALNSFDDINAQMKSIEERVGGIMDELNIAVSESKKLYEKKITEFGE